MALMNGLRHVRWSALLTLLVAGGGSAGPSAQLAPSARAQAPRTLRLYVFDCGVLNITTAGVERYHVTPAEVGETRMSVPCFLIAHPRGTLLWDLGVIPDGDRRGTGRAAPARTSIRPPLPSSRGP